MDLRTRTLARASALTAAGLLAIAVILWLDRVTPNYYSFEIFYVIPILAVTLLAGAIAGGLTGIAAAIAWTFDTVQEDGFAPSSVAWNIGTRLVIFIGVAILIDLYRKRGARLAEVGRHREDALALIAHKLRETAARIGSVTGAIAARRDVDGIVNEARIALDHQARELQRMAEDIFVTELTHMLYRDDTPLHRAAAGLRYDAARALLAAGTPVNAVNRRGATALHWPPGQLSWRSRVARSEQIHSSAMSPSAMR
jgi:hypothetical protein